MDSVKELEERSDTFFDETEEDKILAEINKRYEQSRSTNKQSGAKINTDQFMRDMGVLETDKLGSNLKSQKSAYSHKNADLASVKTPIYEQRIQSNGFDMISPSPVHKEIGKFLVGAPASGPRPQTHAGISSNKLEMNIKEFEA